MVTYDNLVMYFTLYLHCSKHDFIEIIYKLIKFAEYFTISQYSGENDIVVINDKKYMFIAYQQPTIYCLNSVYVMLQNKHETLTTGQFVINTCMTALLN